ncbi:uncharacterized protein K460DRAFT_28919 [Cucurbitaria berberidis CBS 394.84]|uniref:Uncharacterized protein n=1 Tax=Cucurbitaria berberidis CBS 394.84 TaxID=1168544 RepID=A0A9P4GU92_9PLEO|nr:uncharacterized protein K460DRAFT_28919 [Cucurbitaria berberidis CBS 394.84]KAF1851156.1 hypothetical protein K460DRAFT_28919 [Cucurbitaria berberidis CBS 394.84]
MSAAAFYSSDLRCMSKKRYLAYILISASAVACYHIVSTLASKPISASSGLPLVVGYIAHNFFQRQRQRSLQYCVLLSAALLSLGDVAHLIQIYIVADPDTMASAHLAVTHFCLSFLLLSQIEYISRTKNPMPYPDVLIPPPAKMIASYHPNSPICWQTHLSDGREPPAAVFWRAVALDVTVCVLWHVGVWRFTSLLQAWLNPNFQPNAGAVYRPFATAYGFEVVWTSRGVVGCMLQAVMMRPVRILNSYIFAYGADNVGWLRRW